MTNEEMSGSNGEMSGAGGEMSGSNEEMPGRPVMVTVLVAATAAPTDRAPGGDPDDHDPHDHQRLLAETASRHHGGVVNWTGDGVMVVFRDSAIDAVACANEMHEVIERLDDGTSHTVRIGISAGDAVEVIDGDADFQGRPISDAADLCASAGPGQTLVDEVVRGLVGNRGGFAFRRIQPAGSGWTNACSELRRSGSEPGKPERRRAPRRPRRRTMFAALGVALVAVLVVGGVVVATSGGDDPKAKIATIPAATGYQPTYADRSCPPNLNPPVPGAECGTLSVPEDREHPENGRLVRLLVVRAPARGKATGAPVLDFGTDTLSESPAREHAEEIKLSPRGSYGSDPFLDCPDYASAQVASLTKPSDDQATRTSLHDALAACHAQTVGKGIDPNMYNYRADAEDMLDLMRALDLDQVHLVSGQAATIAALGLIEAAPQAVRSLTLESPVVPGQSHVTDPTAQLAAAFDEYARQCQATEICAALGDLHTLYANLQASYATAPSEVGGSMPDGTTMRVLVNGDTAAKALMGSLADPTAIPRMAIALAQPRGSLVVDSLVGGRILASQPLTIATNPPWGAVVSRACSYDVRTIADEHTQSALARPELAGVDRDVAALQAQCDAWDVQPLPNEDFDPTRSIDTPTLIVQGALSPGTSVGWGDELSRQTLTNAKVLTLPSATTSVVAGFGPVCLAELRRSFIRDPGAELDIESCAKEPPEVPLGSNQAG